VADQHSRIFNLHLRLTGDREAAADLTQETFVAAYLSVHTYSGQGQPEACCTGWRSTATGSGTARPGATTPRSRG